MRLKIIFIIAFCLGFSYLLEAQVATSWYLLTDDDVEVTDGAIVKCTKDFTGEYIEIPEVLDGQTITRIAGGYYGDFTDDGLLGVKLPSTVLAIEASAFNGASLLSVIEFEGTSSLLTIGDNAFRATSVAYFPIPASVVSIGKYAFSFCYNATSVNFETPSSLTDIGANAFASTSLMAVNIPSSVEHIEDRAFADNSTLSSLTFEANSSLVSIGSGAFQGTVIQAVDIPSSIQTIGELAFEKVFSLKTLTFQTPSSLTTIGTSAFQSTGIENVEIPGSVITLESYAFGSSSIKTLTFGAGTSLQTIGANAFSNNQIVNLNLPGKLKTIGKSAFSYNSLENVTIPSSVENIEAQAFFTNSISFLSFADGALRKIGDNAFAKNKLTTLILPVGLQILDVGAFRENTLTSVRVSNTVQTISASVFEGNPSLATVSFAAASHLVLVSAKAFDTCPALTAGIRLPTDYDTSIYYDKTNWVFNGIINTGTYMLTFTRILFEEEWYTLTPADVTITGGVITACSYDFSNPYVIIPASLGATEVGALAFNDVDLIKGIRIGESIKTIGASAFYGCDSLHYFDFISPSKLETIASKAFQNTSFDYMDIPASVTTIGERAFNNVNTLSALRFETGSQLKSIGDNAFSYCNIVELELPKSLETIGRSAFFENSQMHTLTFEAGSALKEIGASAFTSNAIRAVELPVGIEKILPYAFSYNNITGVVKIPNTVDSLAAYSFSNNNISALTLEKPVKYTTISAGAFSNNKISDVTIPSEIITIGRGAFKKSEVKKLTFEDNSQLAYIESEAFSDNAITDVLIPNTVIQIGIASFEDNAISSLIFQAESSLEVIDERAFQTNTIGTLNIPKTVEAIGASAFEGAGVAELTFAKVSALEYIGNSAFENNQVVKVEIPASVEIIFDRAFRGNEELDILTFEDGSVLTDIKDFAFENCKIRMLQLPSNLVRIEQSAFRNNSLLGVSLPPTLRYIETNAFRDNTRLTVAAFGTNPLITRIGSHAFTNTPFTVRYRLQLPHRSASEGIYGKWLPSEIIDPTNTHECFTFTPPEQYWYTLQDTDANPTTGGGLKLETSFKGNVPKYLVIPPQIDGVPIDHIPAYEFYNLGLKGVIIPKSVRWIGNNAFEANDSLMEVRFEDNSEIDSIANYAFRGAHLGDINLPDNLRIIGDGVFRSNTDLTEIVSGASSQLSYIGERSFDLTNNSDFKVPASLDSIGDYAFTNNPEFTEIIFPADATIQKIGKGAFQELLLPSVSFPSSLIEIDNHAFKANPISKINFSADAKIEYLGVESFAANEIQDLTLPSSLLHIDERAFVNNGMQKVAFASSGNLHTIGKGAFYQNLLPDVNIPASVVSIEEKAFSENKISQLNFATAANLQTIGEKAFYCNTIGEVNIPNSLITIASAAFKANNISKLNFQAVSSLKQIGNDAFSGESATDCSGGATNAIAELYVPKSVEYMGERAFYMNQIVDLEFESGSFLDTIAAKCFASNKIDTLSLPERILFLASYSFADNDIHILNSSSTLRWISDHTFLNNKNLHTVDFKEPSALYNVSSFAFEGTAILQQHINLPSSYLPNALQTELDEEGWTPYYIITPETSRQTFVRTFKNVEVYKITYYDADTGLRIAPKADWDTIYNEKYPVQLPIPEKDGYKFYGWSESTTVADQISEVPFGATGNKVYYAHWTAPTVVSTYPIIYKDGANIIPPLADWVTSYTGEETVNLPTSYDKGGYNFFGWSLQYYVPDNIKTIEKGEEGGRTFYAHLTPIEYAITYINRGDTLDSDTLLIEDGWVTSYTVKDEIDPLPSLSWLDFDFLGWSEDPDATTGMMVFPEGNVGDKYLHAIWDITKYTISYFGCCKDQLSPEEGWATSFTVFDLVTLPEYKEPGAEFLGWMLEGDTIMEIPQGSNKDVELHAALRYEQYDIVYIDAISSDTIVPQPDWAITYNVKEEVALPVTAPKLGYTFYGWSDSGSVAKQLTNIPVGSEGKKTFYAFYGNGDNKADVFTIRYFDGLTEITPDPVLGWPTSYSVATEVTLPTYSKEGYKFYGWSEEQGVPPQTIDTRIPVATKAYDIIYYAHWGNGGDGQPIKYSIIYVDSTTGLKIPPNADWATEYSYFSSVDLPTDPYKTGYDFYGWSASSTVPDQISFIAAGEKGDTVFYAFWGEDGDNLPVGYDITYIDAITGLEIAPEEGWVVRYTTQEVATLPKATKEGYSFYGWSNTPETPMQLTKIAAGSEGDTILYAFWGNLGDNKPISYTVEYYDKGEILQAQPDWVTTYAIDDAFDLPTLERPGYLFHGWSVNSSEPQGLFTVPVGTTGNLKFYAFWGENGDNKPIQYTITYMDDAVEINPQGNWPVSYTVESSLVLPSASKSEYEFFGWTLVNNDPSTRVKHLKQGETGDKIFYAYWIGENDPLIAVVDNYEATCYDNYLNVTSNDVISSSLAVTVRIVQEPSHGNATVIEGKTILYIPSVVGYDHIRYEVSELGNPLNYSVGDIFINNSEELDCYTSNNRLSDFLFIPEGFSPNGDGVHDYFELDGFENFPDGEMHIYDLQGNKIFEKKNYGSIDVWGAGASERWWNGQNKKGYPVQRGQYLYIYIKGDGGIERGTVMVSY